MKSQTQNIDILTKQSQNSPLSTNDIEKVLCLPLFGAKRNHLKEEWRHFPKHIQSSLEL